MWTDGVAVGTGPHYPVAGAINRPLPERPGGPLLALDLTDGEGAPPLPVALLALCDLVLVPAAGPTAAVPPEVELCEIQGA
jgi:hypothetical protein